MKFFHQISPEEPANEISNKCVLFGHEVDVNDDDHGDGDEEEEHEIGAEIDEQARET